MLKVRSYQLVRIVNYASEFTAGWKNWFVMKFWQKNVDSVVVRILMNLIKQRSIDISLPQPELCFKLDYFFRQASSAYLEICN